MTASPAEPGPTRDLVGYGGRYPRFEWRGGAVALLSFCINYEEGSENTLAEDGRNEGLAEIQYSLPGDIRDLTVESVYEYGSRAGIWRLFDTFAEFDVQATVFAAAVALERNPSVASMIRQRGHEPCSHGWRWEEMFRLSLDEEREHIQRAVESIEQSCGERPRGWYSRYSPSVNTRALLIEEGGFLYDSDAYNDDLPYFVGPGEDRHLVIPYSNVYNDVRYVLAQGHGSPEDFYDSCRAALDQLRLEGRRGSPKMMSVGLHGRWAGQAGRAGALRRFIDYALSCGDVAIERRVDVAEWWIDNADSFTY